METDIMKLASTTRRTLFTASAFIASALPAAGVFATTQAGCANQIIPDGAGGSPLGLPSGSSAEGTTGNGTAYDGAGSGLPGYAPSRACAKCHTSIYEDWESSMHAHSLTSPVMIVQTNQVVAADLSKPENAGLEEFCTGCHSPVSSSFTETGTLPLTSKKPVLSEDLQEGISCVPCHSYLGDPKDSEAVLADFGQGHIAPGKTYHGPIEDPG